MIEEIESLIWRAIDHVGSPSHESAKEAVDALLDRGIQTVLLCDAEDGWYSICTEALPYMGNKSVRLVCEVKLAD